MEETVSRITQPSLHTAIKGTEESVLLEKQAQFIKKQQQQIHFLQEALRFELDRLQWEQSDTPDTFCQRFEFLGAPLQTTMTEDERVHMFKIRCPNFLRRFLVGIEVQSWTDVKKACELKTDMSLQQEQEDFLYSTQSRIQHAQRLLQPRQKRQPRSREGHVEASLRPQQGQNRIEKYRRGSGGQSFPRRRESQQSCRDSGRPSETTKQVKVMSCNNCKGEHKAVDCPAPQVCYRCYKEGHLRRDCPCPTRAAVSTASSSTGVSLSQQKILIVLDRTKASAGDDDQGEGSCVE